MTVSQISDTTGEVAYIDWTGHRTEVAVPTLGDLFTSVSANGAAAIVSAKAGAPAPQYVGATVEYTITAVSPKALYSLASTLADLGYLASIAEQVLTTTR